MKPRGVLPLLVALSLSVVSISSCSNDEVVPQRSTVRLAVNPWLGSELDVAVAKILIEHELSLRVETVNIGEFEQWSKIADGSIDACLEVWPSGHRDDISKYVDSGLVERGGELGPIGKIGWYIPTFVASAHPELKSYEGFKDPANVALFETAESSPRGRFLGVDPSYTQFDEAIIKNLGLDFKVVFAGSEDKLIAEVQRAFDNQTPILFYFWTPHPGINKFDLTKVALPPYSDACYAKSKDKIDCDYPADRLMKVFSLDLARSIPKAHALLRAFNYSTSVQVSLMTSVDNGKTVDEAAHDWVDANPAIWKPWIQ